MLFCTQPEAIDSLYACEWIAQYVFVLVREKGKLDRPTWQTARCCTKHAAPYQAALAQKGGYMPFAGSERWVIQVDAKVYEKWLNAVRVRHALEERR
jgi:hypothetical protein